MTWLQDFAELDCRRTAAHRRDLNSIASAFLALSPPTLEPVIGRVWRTPPHCSGRTLPPAVPAAWIRNIPTGSAQQQTVALDRAVVPVVPHLRSARARAATSAQPPLMRLLAVC
jgi:hypothetical protein